MFCEWYHFHTGQHFLFPILIWKEEIIIRKKYNKEGYLLAHLLCLAQSIMWGNVITKNHLRLYEKQFLHWNKMFYWWYFTLRLIYSFAGQNQVRNDKKQKNINRTIQIVHAYMFWDTISQIKITSCRNEPNLFLP